jgi:hypothetical protein
MQVKGSDVEVLDGVPDQIPPDSDKLVRATISFLGSV